MKNKGNALVIERVCVENFDQFLVLIAKLAEFEKLIPPDESAKERLRRDCLLKTPKYNAFMGRIGKNYVAYVIFIFGYSSFLALPTLFIEDIFVLEEFRRKGIGEKMFDYCKREAERRGCGRIEFIVLKWNKAAQKFYDKNKATRLDWDFYRLTRDNF